MNVNHLPFLFDLGASISEALASLISGIAKFAYGFLDEADLTIDSLMYGVNKGRSSGFFNLETGNVYGVLGARLFVATRNVFLIMVGVTFMYALLRAALSPGALKKMEAKMAIGNVSVALLVIAWVPGILNFFLWLRGFFLRTVMNTLALDNGSLYDVYRSGASEDINKAILLLAFVCVGIYFAFFYITIAIMQTVMLGVLPIIALQSVNETERLKAWFRTFLGWMLIPMVDFVLFLVPVGLVSQGADNLVVLISMFALLPVRKFAFAKLGIEGADVAGIVAAGATTALAAAGKAAGKGVAGAAKGIKEDRDADKSDEENAQLQDDLAKADPDQGRTTGGTSRISDSDNNATGNGANTASASAAATAVPEGAGSRIDANDNSGDSSGSGEVSAADTAPAGTRGAPIGGAETSYSSSDSDKSDKNNPFINAAYQKNATVDNFDKDGYKGHLTHEQMANFYRQRKAERHTGFRTVGRVGRELGAAVGGNVGMAVGAMYGSSGSAISAMNAGRAVGGVAGYGVGYATGMAAAGVPNYRRGLRSEIGVAAAGAPMDWMSEATTEAPVQPASAGASIEPYEFDNAQNGPVDYQGIADSAVPESNFSAGKEAAQWLTNTFTDKTAFSVTGGIGSDLTESVAYNDRSISVLDMFAGAGIANGMMPADGMSMNFSNSYQDATSPQLMYGSVGRAQVAASYLRNPDGSALATDAESLRAEREKLRKARAVAMAHTSVEGGQFMFTPWSPQELTAHREVLQRFTGQGQGFSYLNNAKAKMRTENNGATPVINYKHQQTDKTTGAKTTVGRKFYNRAADQVVNRQPSSSQEQRADAVSRFFESQNNNQQ